MERLRYRNFIFVVHNYTDDDIEHLKKFECRYIVFGKEICPTTGTPHLQGYCELHDQMSGKQLKETFHRSAHIEKRAKNSNAKAASDYCKKDGDYYESGKLSQPGKRNDIVAIRDEIKANPNITTRQIVERLPESLARYPRFVSTVRALYAEKVTLNWTEPPNLWFYGPSGSGKSSTARAMSSSLYDKLQSKWWDDYDGEEDVLIDDLHPDAAKCIVTYIKRWADRYPFRAEIKGGVVYIRPKRIFVTTQYTLTELFPLQADREAIFRRFIFRDPTPYIEKRDALQEEPTDQKEAPTGQEAPHDPY